MRVWRRISLARRLQGARWATTAISTASDGGCGAGGPWPAAAAGEEERDRGPPAERATADPGVVGERRQDLGRAVGPAVRQRVDGAEVGGRERRFGRAP